MFNRKTIKRLEARIDSLQIENEVVRDAIDLIVDEMGFELTTCDCCGELTLNK